MKKTIVTKLVSLFASLCMLSPVVLTGFASRQYFKEEYSSDFRGAGIPTIYSETVNYDHKDTVSVSIKYGVPYYNLNALGNKCANLAGAVVIGYYDRFFENLIPDFKAYTQLGSHITYKGSTSEVNNLVDTLYVLMSTDVGHSGTDFNGFNKGMTTYVKNHGYIYAKKEVWNKNLIEYDNAIDEEKPVAVFASGFSLISKLSERDGKDEIEIQKYKDKHVMVGYGYRIDKYYDKNNNLIDTRTYLTVYNGGMINRTIKYLWLDGNTTVDHALAVTIS